MTSMDKVTASFAKQSFGTLLELAASSPVGIEMHGKLIAAMVPADWLERGHLLDERRQAREDQKRVEERRLMAHQRVAIELLSRPEHKARWMAAARSEVQRWAKHNLCSQDYIERWTEWLALPAADLVERMCSDAEGWGTAMRQNSPFLASSR
jgi:hypothetical protein